MLVQHYPSFGSTNLTGGETEEAEPLQSVARRKSPQVPPIHKMSRHVLHPPLQHRASSPGTAGLAAELHRVPFRRPQPVLSSPRRGLSPEVSGASCAGRLVLWAVLRLACWKAQESRNTPGMRSPKYSLLLAAIAWYFISSRYSGVSFSYEKQKPETLRDNFLGPAALRYMSGSCILGCGLLNQVFSQCCPHEADLLCRGRVSDQLPSAHLVGVSQLPSSVVLCISFCLLPCQERSI